MTEPCSLVEGERAGWRALTLRNGCIEVTVLPGKGCEIYEFRDRSTGVDVLFKSPWGLQPPGAPPREGSERHGVPAQLRRRLAGAAPELQRRLHATAASSCRSTARSRSAPWDVERRRARATRRSS